MKITGRWDLRSLVGKLMMGLVLASMVGGMGVTSASAGDRDEHREYRDHDNGRHEGWDRGRGHERYRHRRVVRPYGYVEPAPVYVPPPVYYAPPPPEPGISIFLPSIHIR